MNILINIILPLLYLSIFSWLIVQYKLFAGTVFTTREVLIIFFLKTFWCVAYGIYYQRVGYSDTFDMFNASEQIYRSLFRDPRDFFQLVFLPNNVYFTNGVEHYVRSIDMYGNEGSYFLLRFHALVRFFSFGSYYVHAIFFSFATLPGVMMLLNYFLKPRRDARFCVSADDKHLLTDAKRDPKSCVSTKNKYLITGLMLLFPGIAFWCSGMHKEALVILSFGLIFHFAEAKRITIKNIISLSAGILLLIIIRPLFMLLFAPFLIAIFTDKIFGFKSFIIYFISFIILPIIVYASNLLNIYQSFLQIILKKRIEFAQLNESSNSKLPYYLFILNWIVCGGISVYMIIDSVMTNDEGRWVLRQGYFIRMANTFSSLQNASSLMILISSCVCFFIVEYIVSGYGALIRYEAPLLLLMISAATTLRERDNLILLK